MVTVLAREEVAMVDDSTIIVANTFLVANNNVKEGCMGL